MEIKNIEFYSCFAQDIVNFIAEKRALGFSYRLEEAILKRFDDFCLNNRIDEKCITRAIALKWELEISDTGKSFKKRGISTLRLFAEYLTLHGKTSYISRKFADSHKVLPHILGQEELQEFFCMLDSQQTKSHDITFKRLCNEYKIIFRLIYCCGLRNSEACNLLISDFIPEEKKVIIRHSKGDKDRIVYIAEDLADLLKEYKNCILQFLLKEPVKYVFPGKYSSSPLQKTHLTKKFNEIWNKTSYSKTVDKKPTIHSLRHTFVVNRINGWIEQGHDVKYLMPYLAKYLGHSSTEETFYYYHMTKDAFKTIRDNDSLLNKIIPEVIYDED